MDGILKRYAKQVDERRERQQRFALGDEGYRLFKAAPDLLDTLKSTVEWLQTGKVDGVGFDEQSIIDDLVEAITKAKGGE